MKHTLFISVFLILAVINSYAQGALAKPLYKNPAAPIEQRIKDLLQRMTLEDKCRQLDVWHPKMDLSKSEVLQKAITALGDTVSKGIGFLQFEVEMNQRDYTARFNAIQKYFMEKTPLGIPAISNGEGCHG
ncbi:MAG TPA: hypothetical protein VK205_12075, partial [Prolixibacteraceae bacterium]|nr:hypothetical protein [Prolixibacteraceae bacterium]